MRGYTGRHCGIQALNDQADEVRNASPTSSEKSELLYRYARSCDHVRTTAAKCTNVQAWRSDFNPTNNNSGIMSKLKVPDTAKNSAKNTAMNN